MVDRLNSLMVTAYMRITNMDLRREEGQALTEYALVLALIVVGAVAALTVIGTSVTDKIKAVCRAVTPNGTGC
jgi:Flp pilus assembly pilin Flp